MGARLLQQCDTLGDLWAEIAEYNPSDFEHVLVSIVIVGAHASPDRLKQAKETCRILEEQFDEIRRAAEGLATLVERHLARSEAFGMISSGITADHLDALREISFAAIPEITEPNLLDAMATRQASDSDFIRALLSRLAEHGVTLTDGCMAALADCLLDSPGRFSNDGVKKARQRFSNGDN